MKTKSPKVTTPRSLYSPWRMGPTLTVFRHRIVREEPTRLLIEADSEGNRRDGRESSPVVYADRAELETHGFTLSRDSRGRMTHGPILGLDHAAAVKAIAWWDKVRREFKLTLPGKLDLSAPHDVKAAHYAEVVRGIPCHWSQASRGVRDLGDGTALVFGNDASPEERRFEHEVYLFRRRLAQDGRIEELGYAVSQDRESWAMLVRRVDGEPPDENLIDHLAGELRWAWFDVRKISGRWTEPHAEGRDSTPSPSIDAVPTRRRR